MKAKPTQQKTSENPQMSLEEFSELPVMRELLESGSRKFAVAVSGGPDSMALCRLLSDWAAENSDIEVHALTVDHALRAESVQEAKAVGECMASWPCVTHTVLKRNKDNIHHARIQEDARKDRYALMAEYCREKGIADLLLAHHGDDQAETLLFRMAKGSGLDGLAAMACKSPLAVSGEDSGLTLWRPFLGTEKAELVRFCDVNNIEYVNDPSNKNTDFARARLRKAYDVLAAEGLTTKRLLKLASRMERASDALDHYAKASLAQIEQSASNDDIILDYKDFSALPDEIQLRAMVLSMRKLCESTYNGTNGYGPRTEKMEDLVFDLARNTDYADRTLGGFIIRLNRKNATIVIEKEI